MRQITINDFTLKITVNKKGADVYKKVSYPLRVGIYSEIETKDYIFQYDLNGEIKYIQGKKNWPNPLEWLKRTKTNQWIYYFAGEYNDIFDAIGEYYLPCFTYPTNSLWKRDPFKDPEVKDALKKWKDLHHLLQNSPVHIYDEKNQNFLEKIKKTNPLYLQKRSEYLYSIIGKRINVLPPDTRHVDYEIIPVIISDGCVYGCKFCMVKSQMGFKERAWQDVKNQIKNLKEFYSFDIINYNAIFLGENDALNCNFNLFIDSAMFAYEELLKKSCLKGKFLFAFGSVKSFMRLKDQDLEVLNSLPFYTYINIGLESADKTTLRLIGKPLDEVEVKECFERAIEVNKKFLNLEITVNFLFDLLFPPSHFNSIESLVGANIKKSFSKGCVYLSPLNIPTMPKEMLRFFKEFKRKSRLPMYLYIIQKF